MKKRLIGLLLIYISTNLTLSAQNIEAQRVFVNEKTVPKLILSTFKNQYHDILLKGWYVTHLNYWQNDYSSDWYNGWYGQRTIIIYPYQKPNYYEVEFIDNPGELSRAIYNIHGYWYETRTQIKGLTPGIIETLKASKYDGWKISSTKEKLVTPAWPDEIYRFQVSKGLKSEIIRMDAKGTLIQVKELNHN
jgi:hypothetical protein